jgi:hypothetical protein
MQSSSCSSYLPSTMGPHHSNCGITCSSSSCLEGLLYHCRAPAGLTGEDQVPTCTQAHSRRPCPCSHPVFCCLCAGGLPHIAPHILVSTAAAAGAARAGGLQTTSTWLVQLPVPCSRGAPPGPSSLHSRVCNSSTGECQPAGQHQQLGKATRASSSRSSTGQAIAAGNTQQAVCLPINSSRWEGRDQKQQQGVCLPTSSSRPLTPSREFAC